MNDYAMAKYCRRCRGTLEFTRNMNREFCPACSRKLENVKLCNRCGSGTPQSLSNQRCIECGTVWKSGGWEKDPLYG